MTKVDGSCWSGDQHRPALIGRTRVREAGEGGWEGGRWREVGLGEAHGMIPGGLAIH